MKARSNLFWIVLFGGLATLTLGTLAIGLEEVDVTLDQVPDAVRQTILREAAGATITEIERETRNGKTTYEAEFMSNGREIEIKIAPDGTVLKRETERSNNNNDLTLDRFPAPARESLQRVARGATITSVEREMEHGVMVYEAS